MNVFWTFFSSLLTLTLVAITSDSDAFEVYTDPYEGIPYFKIVSDELILHENPSSRSPLGPTIFVERGVIITSNKKWLDEIRLYPKDWWNSLLKKGEVIFSEEVFSDRNIQITISTGILKAVSDGSFEGFSYGKVDSLDFSFKSKEKTFSYKKGDVIEELVYVGEGDYLYRIDGEVFIVSCCLYIEPHKKSTLVRISRSVSQWWVGLTKDGRDIGWVKMDGKAPIELLETIK